MRFSSFFTLTATMPLQHTSGITEVLWFLEHEVQIQGEFRDFLVSSVIKQIQFSYLRHCADSLPQLLHSPFGILEVLFDYLPCREFFCMLFGIVI